MTPTVTRFGVISDPPLAIQLPTIEDVPLDAQVCDYYNEETIYLEGFKGNSLVPSELTNSYHLNGAPQGEIPQCQAPAKKQRRTTAGDFYPNEKRSGLECTTRGKLNFTNLPNAGPWRTPEPEFLTSKKHILLTWSPGVVVTSLKMYGVGGYGEAQWGVAVYKAQSCQTLRDPQQTYVVIPPREDHKDFLMLEFQFDPKSLPVDKKVKVALIDAAIA
ncbi:MAG: hypothetical protein Q9192_007460 [Flavoplaca navasiana]